MTSDLTLVLYGAAVIDEAEPALSMPALIMDEEAFRLLYARTARPLHGYLRHISGNASLADDLLQETYYRFLRAKLPEMSEEHSKSYLYRIASNLMRDHLRGSKRRELPALEGVMESARSVEPAGAGTGKATGSDFSRVFRQLKPRYREMLWMAYVEGSSHKEIAEVVGLKAQSVRPLLFRARAKLAALLRKRGLAPREDGVSGEDGG